MKRIFALLGAASMLALSAMPVAAITYGQPDENRHPNVGALVGTFDGQTYPYCSGTLISPTVFLTAAHCDIGEATVFVTFDETYTSRSKLYEGTFIAHPDYSQTQSDPNDIAVVIFDRPIRGIEPAELPTLGLLDEMKADGTLNQSTQFTSVGYGSIQYTTAPGGPKTSYPDARYFSVGSFNALGPGYLRLSQNPSTGDAGTCYGDSGGPIFLGAGDTETDTVVAITVTGDTFCRSTNVVQRLDTESALTFLGQYVDLG
jgi:secreted trypsin-like serine protease